MNEFIVGAILGALAGVIVGILYDNWRVSKIVDLTILSYRVEKEKDRAERLRKFIDETGEGE